MVEPIEGIAHIPKDNDDMVRINLTPRGGKPDSPPSLSQNEEMVIERVQMGDCAFAGVLLETGFDKDLLDAEREVYDVQKELGFLDYEINLCDLQLKLIKEYTENLYDTDNPRQLKLKLFSGLSNTLEDKVREAIDKDLKEEELIKGMFRLFKAPIIDPSKLRLEYLQHFQEYNYSIEKTKILEMQDSLKNKLELLMKKREKISASLDDIRFVKREIDNLYFNFNNSQLAIYQDLVRNTQTFKIVPSYCVNVDVMREVLQFKVSPNLVDPKTGESLLHIALANGHKEMVKLLIARRADPLQTNRREVSAIKAAAMKDDRELLGFLTEALKKTDFLCDQVRQTYINELHKYLRDLPKAKEILDDYAQTLLDRKRFPLIIRLLLFFETRIDSRQKDFDVYYRKLKEACDALDPQIFFNEVLRRAPSAERGILHRSLLHEPLIELLVDFLRRFDRLGFTQAKEAILIANANNATSPVFKRQSEEIKSAKDDNNTLKIKVENLTRDLQNVRLELQTIKEAIEREKRDNTPRRGDNEVKMTPLSSSSIFRP